MTDHNQIDILLQRSEPITPASTAPSLNELQVRVWKRRRRRRKILRVSVFGPPLLCALALALWQPEVGLDEDTTASSAAVSQHDEPTPSKSPVTLASDESSGVRVFAKVRRQIPIFGLEKGTQHLRHLGWIDSPEVVPVDLSQFPNDQLKSIEAVLYENDTNEYFNL